MGALTVTMAVSARKCESSTVPIAPVPLFLLPTPANGAVNLVIARRALESEYLAARVWSTADAEPEEPGGRLGVGSHPQPRESLWPGSRQGGRCWTGPVCATANTCGAGYANAWPKAKGAGRKRFCLRLVSLFVTLQRGYYLKLEYSEFCSNINFSNAMVQKIQLTTCLTLIL